MRFPEGGRPIRFGFQPSNQYGAENTTMISQITYLISFFHFSPLSISHLPSSRRKENDPRVNEEIQLKSKLSLALACPFCNDDPIPYTEQSFHLEKEIHRRRRILSSAFAKKNRSLCGVWIPILLFSARLLIRSVRRPK